MAGRKRGMPAKHHFNRRCEPAQFVIGAAGGGYDKGGFGQIVFGGDRLENGIVQPAVQRDDRGGIARERAIGKGINLGEIGDYHVRSVSRSEEHTSELQSLMRNSYAVFCLKKKNK